MAKLIKQTPPLNEEETEEFINEIENNKNKESHPKADLLDDPGINLKPIGKNKRTIKFRLNYVGKAKPNIILDKED